MCTEATFRMYLDEEEAVKNIPTLNMITMPMEELERKANLLYAEIEKLKPRCRCSHRRMSVQIVKIYASLKQ